MNKYVSVSHEVEKWTLEPKCTCKYQFCNVSPRRINVKRQRIELFSLLRTKHLQNLIVDWLREQFGDSTIRLVQKQLISSILYL